MLAAFQPTLPARGATWTVRNSPHNHRAFQPTLPARGATTLVMAREPATQTISTHAPRTGSDGNTRNLLMQMDHFNPRSPHGERRAGRGNGGVSADFNPRSPHGERRPPADGHAAGAADFNPRSPHGERHPQGARHCLPRHISTHAPRTGSDILSVTASQ